MKDKAELLYREERTYSGGIVEMVVWRVPEPVPPSEHPFKYRLVFVRDGKRLVGYDNERSKGGHRHIDNTETPYSFEDENQLLENFWQDVKEITK
ncbi:MAG: toxin-antitoxin system TumE family protein [Pseudomonadota bacterium]